MKLYLVKDGIVNVGCKTNNGKQVDNSNYHLITYDFKSNEGYIDKKGLNKWKFYTQVGQKIGKGRYHHFQTFQECVNKLKELKGDDEIMICKSTEIEMYKK